jgi:hypothetical protein
VKDLKTSGTRTDGYVLSTQDSGASGRWIAAGGAADSAVFVTHTDDTDQRFKGALAVTGATALNGTVALGDAAGDSLTFPGTIASGASGAAVQGLTFKSRTGGYKQTIVASSGGTGDAVFYLPKASYVSGTPVLTQTSSTATSWTTYPSVTSLTTTTTLSSEGATYLGDAAGDSTRFYSTVAIGDGDASPSIYNGMKFKNNGGTGVTTMLPPRVTASSTAKMLVTGQLITTSRTGGGGKSTPVAGMTTAGWCSATKVRTATDTRTNVVSCACITDSIIVYSSVAVDTLNYAWTK